MQRRTVGELFIFQRAAESLAPVFYYLQIGPKIDDRPLGGGSPARYFKEFLTPPSLLCHSVSIQLSRSKIRSDLMGFLSWLFRRFKPSREPVNIEQPKTFAKEAVNLEGPGTFAGEIVGESHYQEALARICGGRSFEGASDTVQAFLVCDDNNPYDDQAVRIDIAGETVGYLSRSHARHYRSLLKEESHHGSTATCSARIVGGWYRGDDDVGTFGVKLDLPRKYLEPVAIARVNDKYEIDHEKSITMTFDIDSCDPNELMQCRVGEPVKLWKRSEDADKILVFRHGTIYGGGRIGFVPDRFFHQIASHMDNSLVRDTEIVEVSTNRCRIKCKLISQAFLKAKKDKETQGYINELTKKYSPQKPIVFIFDAKAGHKLQVGDKLQFRFKDLDSYASDRYGWSIDIVDSHSRVVGTKRNDKHSEVTRILKAHFNSYTFDVEVKSVAPKHDWYKHPVEVEAKPIKGH